MKKLIALFFAAMVTIQMVSAQTASTLYKFTEATQSDVVLKAMNVQLKLSQTEFSAVQQLLSKSAASQIEQYKSDAAKDPAHVANVLRRQTAHIEGNMKNILGEDKYKLYETQKPAIEKMVKELNAR